MREDLLSCDWLYLLRDNVHGNKNFLIKNENKLVVTVTSS